MAEDPKMWRSNGQRITRQLVSRKIERLQRMGLDVALDGSYGRYKVTNRKESRNLSGRMKNADVIMWLDAYEQGWEAGRKWNDKGADDQGLRGPDTPAGR